MHYWLVALLVTLAVALAAISVVFAAPPEGKGKPSHDEVVAYWTPDRIGNAKPRDITPTGRPDFVEPQKPGGGPPKGKGGGKKGGGGAVEGASWALAGLVKATVGKVFFTLGEDDFVCSGTVVTDKRSDNLSVVLTAGHCVFDERDGNFASFWLFAPDYDAAPASTCAALRYGCWTADHLVTSTGWSTPDDPDFNEDWGFAVMGPGGLSGSASLEGTVGTQDIVFSSTRPATVYAFGYPHAFPYGGADLVYCSGPTVADTWGFSTDSGLKCDMTGGSSGGGWFSGFDENTGVGDLVSLNSFRYLRGKASKYMFGPLFD